MEQWELKPLTVFCLISAPTRAWNTLRIWSPTAPQQAEAVPQLICCTQAALSPSLAHTKWVLLLPGLPRHWGTPGDPSQPLDAVPEGFPQAIFPIPSRPHSHVPVFHAIPCGTGLLSYGQLDPTHDLTLEAAGNGSGFPGMSWLLWPVWLPGMNMSWQLSNLRGITPPIYHPADTHPCTRLHEISQILTQESPFVWVPGFSLLFFPEEHVQHGGTVHCTILPFLWRKPYVFILGNAC